MDEEPILCPHCNGPLKDDWGGYPSCFCLWGGEYPDGDDVAFMAETEELLERLTRSPRREVDR
jgi:hypothetical protein